MSWHTDNAFKRIVNVFKRSKEKVYKEDIAALQLISDEILNSQKNYVNDNQLFAKLLCQQLRQSLNHFRSMRLAIKDIDNCLKTPLSHHLEMLRTDLNHKDFIDYMEGLGIEMDHLNYSSNNNDIILKDNQKEVQDKLLKFWNFDKVEKSFYNSANELLKDINNYN